MITKLTCYSFEKILKNIKDDESKENTSEYFTPESTQIQQRFNLKLNAKPYIKIDETENGKLIKFKVNISKDTMQKIMFLPPILDVEKLKSFEDISDDTEVINFYERISSDADSIHFINKISMPIKSCIAQISSTVILNEAEDIFIKHLSFNKHEKISLELLKKIIRNYLSELMQDQVKDKISINRLFQILKQKASEYDWYITNSCFESLLSYIINLAVCDYADISVCIIKGKNSTFKYIDFCLSYSKRSNFLLFESDTARISFVAYRAISEVSGCKSTLIKNIPKAIEQNRILKFIEDTEEFEKIIKELMTIDYCSYIADTYPASEKDLDKINSLIYAIR